MAHIHELYDFVATAFIVHHNRVLLVHHKKLDTWLPVGGHIELNEDPWDAVLREVEEEVGIRQADLEVVNNQRLPVPPAGDGKPLPPPFEIHVHHFDANHQHIALNYVFRAKSDQFTHQPLELNEARWFTKAELEAKQSEILPNVYNYASFALKLAS